MSIAFEEPDWLDVEEFQVSGFIVSGFPDLKPNWVD